MYFGNYGRTLGWQVPLSETQWCTTAPDEHMWQIRVHGETLRRAPRKEGFRALGVRVTFDNSQECELNERIRRSWRAFYKYSDILCCRDCPIGPRLILLDILVSSSLFWCAGSWNLTHTQQTKLRGVQQSMIRKMLGLRCRSHESLEEFCIRYARSVKHVLRENGQEAWDAKYFRLYFVWAGRVQRLALTDPLRLTYQALNLKN